MKEVHTFFLDRDPSSFNLILSYVKERRADDCVDWLRSTDVLTDANIGKFASDAVFYGLPALAEATEKWKEGCRLLAAFSTISSAKAIRHPNDVIVLAGQVYNERLMIGPICPFHVVIEGVAGQTVITNVAEEDGGHPTIGVVGDGVSLTLRNLAVKNDSNGGYSVSVEERATLVMEGCEASTLNGDGLYLNAAFATLINTKVHNCGSSGVHIHDGGTCEMNSCEIFENKRWGIDVHERGTAT